jgi:hypothetical protein
MTLPQVQPVEVPNVLNSALTMLQAQNMKGQRADRLNTALNEKKRLELEQTKLIRDTTIDANEFALNLLSGVNSEEDLTIAKRQFSSRYPMMNDMVDKLLPGYDPRGVDLLRNSLRTETERLKLEKGEEIKGFGAGTHLYKGEKKIGEVPSTPQKEDYEVFEGPDGDQVYIKKGSNIPSGYRKVQGKSGEVNVYTGDLGKTTKTQLEQDVIQGVQNIKSFQSTRSKFKDEYLTVFGKGEKMVAEAVDKLGMSSGDQKKFISERASWFRQAKADFIAYRKWATGVAGGEKEMQEIATAFPDPVKNSPAQYRANLDNIEETTKKILMLNADFLRSGINTEQPLGDMLKQAKEAGIIDNIPDVALEDRKDDSIRPDGSKKGSGWLGPQNFRAPSGESGVATEYSVGVNIEGKEIDIPTLVPTLTKEELKTMIDDIIPNRKPVPKEILNKAIDHAKTMIGQGKSPFKEETKVIKYDAQGNRVTSP